MKLRLAGLVVAFIAVVSTCAPFARADNAGVNVQTGTISGTGNLAPLNVQNDNVCQLQFTGAGTATVTAQGASDYVPTYNNISGAVSQAIAAAGTLSFAIPTALLVVRINVGTYGSTPIPYTLTCSGTQSNTAAGGGSNVTIVGPLISPTTTPSPAAPGLPVVAYGQMQCGTVNLYCNLTGGGSGATGTQRNSLNVDVCVAAATSCVIPSAAPGDAGANAVAVFPSVSYNVGFNGTTWDRAKTAASPAPIGIMGQGYNTAGTAAPIICTKTAGGSGTTDGNVQILALSGTTHVYVCEVDISVGGSVAGSLRLISGTGSACATPVNQGPGVEFATTGTSSIAVGTGVGIVFDGGASNELCIGGTGTSTLYIYHLMYEQF